MITEFLLMGFLSYEKAEIFHKAQAQKALARPAAYLYIDENPKEELFITQQLYKTEAECRSKIKKNYAHYTERGYEMNCISVFLAGDRK